MSLKRFAVGIALAAIFAPGAASKDANWTPWAKISSAGGKAVVAVGWSSDNGEDAPTDLYLADLATGVSKPVASVGPCDDWISPLLTGDGKTILFNSPTGMAGSGLRRLSLEGQKSRRLTWSVLERETPFAASRNGDKLLVHRGLWKGGFALIGSVWLYELSGSRVTKRDLGSSLNWFPVSKNGFVNSAALIENGRRVIYSTCDKQLFVLDTSSKKVTAVGPGSDVVSTGDDQSVIVEHEGKRVLLDVDARRRSPLRGGPARVVGNGKRLLFAPQNRTSGDLETSDLRGNDRSVVSMPPGKVSLSPSNDPTRGFLVFLIADDAAQSGIWSIDGASGAAKLAVKFTIGEDE